MSDTHDKSKEEFLSPADMQWWLQQEIKELAKANELRLTQANQFVNDYAMGKLTGQEADDALNLYRKRWPEALPGVILLPAMTDEEIVKTIDNAQEVTPGPVLREILNRRSRHASSEKSNPPG